MRLSIIFTSSMFVLNPHRAFWFLVAHAARLFVFMKCHSTPTPIFYFSDVDDLTFPDPLKYCTVYHFRQYISFLGGD